MKLVSNVNEKFHEKATGPYSNKAEVLVDVIAGVPFDVPDDLGKARIQASPNRYHEATDADKEFAKKYAKAKIEELQKLTSEEKFDPKSFLSNADNCNAESLGELGKEEVLAVADFLAVDYPKNPKKEVLVSLIVKTFELAKEDKVENTNVNQSPTE